MIMMDLIMPDWALANPPHLGAAENVT